MSVSFVELRYYYLRNGRSGQVKRALEFLSVGYAPAARRAGIGPIGIFRPMIAADAPFFLVVLGHASLAAMQASMELMSKDAVYQSALTEFHADAGLPYVRMESSLLRCFRSVPTIETGVADAVPGIFELRTYESDNEATLARKIGMFDEGEIALFRKHGIRPVFFGEAIIGPKLPRLTYMVAFPSMTEREKAWGAFIGDPEWKSLYARPGLSDEDIVSNSGNMILRAVEGAEIARRNTPGR